MDRKDSPTCPRLPVSVTSVSRLVGWMGKRAQSPSGVVQESSRSCHRPGRKVNRRVRHARQRVRRLNAVARAVHSAATLGRPRKRKLRAPCCSLTMPKTGSTNCFLSLYTFLASSVDIQSRHPGSMTGQRFVVSAYHQRAATDAVFGTHSEGWTRPADRRRSSVAPLQGLSGMLGADKAQRPTLETDIAVALLIIGEMVPVIRVLRRPAPCWLRHRHPLTPASALLQVASRVITRIGQCHPRFRSGRRFGPFEHWSQLGIVSRFIHKVHGGDQHPAPAPI